MFLNTDSIEANVEHAQIHVEEGTKQLSAAQSYQVRQVYMSLLLVPFL